MHFDDFYTLYLAYGISNIVGLLLLWAAVKSPKVARLLFSLLFGWACWVNYTTSHARPEFYLSYADHSIGIYADFIRGWFSRHITPVVSTIAVCQGLIAFGLWLRNWPFKLACTGIIVFLLAIAPLGLYAAFPFSLIVSGAAWFMLKNEVKIYSVTPCGSMKRPG